VTRPVNFCCGIWFVTNITIAIIKREITNLKITIMTTYFKNPNFKNTMFNELPNMFDDLLSRDIFSWPAKNVSSSKANTPAVNVKETDIAYELHVAAPGLSKEDFKIELNGKTLTISSKVENNVRHGEEEKHHESHLNISEETKTEKFTRKEFNFQSFSRSFNIPLETVGADNISAAYKDGILNVNVPKKEKTEVKNVKEIHIS
jgi:HSP20 family protein